MQMNRIFKKKEIFKVKSVPIDPTTMGTPTTVDEYQKRGMAYYARKQFKEAEQDLNKAVSINGGSIDAYYSLGMVLKAMGRKDEAASAFKHAVAMISAMNMTGDTRLDM